VAIELKNNLTLYNITNVSVHQKADLEQFFDEVGYTWKLISSEDLLCTSK